jgi:hypothetical protein
LFEYRAEGVDAAAIGSWPRRLAPWWQVTPQADPCLGPATAGRAEAQQPSAQ